MIMTAYGPQEVIEEVARALQKLRPATWGLEQRSFSSAFPVYQSFFFSAKLRRRPFPGLSKSS